MPQTKKKVGKPANKSTSSKKKQTPTKTKVSKVKHNPKPLIIRACSLNDAFCAHAQKGHYGDSGNVRSLPKYIHYSQPFGTDANGNAAVMILPNYQNFGFAYGSNITAYGFDTTTLPTRSNTYIPAQARLVTYGFTIRCISAPLYRAGIVRIRVFSFHDGQRLGTVNTNTFYCDEYLDIPLADCKEIAIQLRRTTDAAKLWRLPDWYSASNGTVTDWYSPGFQCAAIQLIGGPASVGALQIEFHEHWETVMGDDDPIQEYATKHEPTTTLEKDISDAVSNAGKSIFKEGVKAAGDFVLREAKNAVASYGLGLVAAIAA